MIINRLECMLFCLLYLHNLTIILLCNVIEVRRFTSIILANFFLVSLFRDKFTSDELNKNTKLLSSFAWHSNSLWLLGALMNAVDLFTAHIRRMVEGTVFSLSVPQTSDDWLIDTTCSFPTPRLCTCCILLFVNL